MRHRPGPAAPRGWSQVPAAGDGNSAQYAPTQFGVPRSASPGRRSGQFGSPTPTPSPENPYSNPLLLPAYPGPVNTVPVNAGPAKQAVRCRIRTRRVSMALAVCGRGPHSAGWYGPPIWGRRVPGVSPVGSRRRTTAKQSVRWPAGVVGILGIWVCFVGLPVGIVAILGPMAKREIAASVEPRPVRAWRPRVSCSADCDCADHRLPGVRGRHRRVRLTRASRSGDDVLELYGHRR